MLISMRFKCRTIEVHVDDLECSRESVECCLLISSNSIDRDIILQFISRFAQNKDLAYPRVSESLCLRV